MLVLDQHCIRNKRAFLEYMHRLVFRDVAMGGRSTNTGSSLFHCAQLRFNSEAGVDFTMCDTRLFISRRVPTLLYVRLSSSCYSENSIFEDVR